MFRADNMELFKTERRIISMPQDDVSAGSFRTVYTLVVLKNIPCAKELTGMARVDMHAAITADQLQS